MALDTVGDVLVRRNRGKPVNVGKRTGDRETVRLCREIFCVLSLLCGHFAMDYSKAVFNIF
jgi:hypothetical protein